MGSVLQHLGPRDHGAILNLLRGSGQPSCAEPHGIAISPNYLDNGSSLASPDVRWMAGVYFADELTSVVQACDGSFDGQLETSLFVDEKWRRQGIGTLLLKATMDWASLRRASTLRFVCARTDWPMRRLAEKFGARLDLVLGQIVADISLGQCINERQRAPSKPR
jgi:GNAT superfamily N-acetyltransferase